ncbi:hypothetical protein FisN_4Lh146 [Fistulifera solaris]|uniref:BZIP domain-containing protein n=1 Tax=Fistulifera solaris TaxID=1519565 RepID=A0A1Z5JZC8_FISSO|nr:hypothetical protein FisN_4Lh146 [Fistulifera solaris]|eukprot:GAX19279.1 hypothetical protein FisN_4Lh146 [Fistulifera solaris]
MPHATCHLSSLDPPPPFSSRYRFRCSWRHGPQPLQRGITQILFLVALKAYSTLSTSAMAESVSVSVPDKVNEINDSESETQSDRYHGTSDEEDTNHAGDNDEKAKLPDQDRSQTPQRRESNKKRTRDESEEEEADEGMKRDERRAANRLSAFQSRQRRKSIISDLQKTVAQLSRDGDDQRKKNRERTEEFERLCKENELLRSQLLGAEGDSTQAAAGSQKLDLASLMPGLNFPAGSSAHTQDPLLLSNALIDLWNPGNARAHPLAGQLPDQLRQQYLALQQVAGAASAPVNTEDQIIGVLALLSHIEAAPSSNANVTQLGSTFPSVIRNQPYQPQAQVDPAQIQHLLELLRQSNDRNIDKNKSMQRRGK